MFRLVPDTTDNLCSPSVTPLFSFSPVKPLVPAFRVQNAYKRYEDFMSDSSPADRPDRLFPFLGSL